jgi:hypothetical protein
MPLFRRRSTAGQFPDAIPGLVAENALVRSLDDAIHRHGGPSGAVAVLCIIPQLLPGEHITHDEAQMVTRSLARQLRRADAVAALADGAYVAVLPDTPGDAAQIVAQRIAGDLSIRSAGINRRNFLIGLAVYPHDAAIASDLIDAAVRSAASSRLRAA